MKKYILGIITNGIIVSFEAIALGLEAVSLTFIVASYLGVIIISIAKKEFKFAIGAALSPIIFIALYFIIIFFMIATGMVSPG